MSETLTAADLPEILDCFGRVYVIDTEYHPQLDLPDGPVVPVALQAYEVRSGTWVSAFFEETNASYADPLDPDALYLTFNASAEWNFFLPPTGRFRATVLIFTLSSRTWCQASDRRRSFGSGYFLTNGTVRCSEWFGGADCRPVPSGTRKPCGM